MRKLITIFMIYCIMSCSILSVAAEKVSEEKVYSFNELATFDINDLDENMNLAEAIDKYPIIKQIYYIGLSDEEAKKMGLDVTLKDEKAIASASDINAKQLLSNLNAMRPAAVKAKMGNLIVDESLDETLMPISLRSSYGVAWAYVQNNLTTTNCYGYSIGYNAFINPGDIYYYYGATYSTSSTVSDVADNMIRDAGRSGVTARKINSATASINSNEYRIVTRVGYHYINGIGFVWDYHWMRQNSSGGWCHKPGKNPSINVGSINPSTYSWDIAGVYTDFYDSTPVYIATPKLSVCSY